MGVASFNLWVWLVPDLYFQKLEPMSKVCNKQFITLGHCEIWSHFTRTLYFHSPSARDNTVTTHEISRHISR